MINFITNLKLQNRFTRRTVLIILAVVLLVIVVTLLIYLKFFAHRKEAFNVDVDTWTKITRPAIQQTQEAYQVIKKDLPYTDPAGDFTIKYFEEPSMFVVDTGAKTWPEYAEKIKKSGEFFKSRGVDPCSLKRIWGANPVLLTIPRPEGLDFGCPVNVK